MAARDHVTIYTTKFDIFKADIQNLEFLNIVLGVNHM